MFDDFIKKINELKEKDLKVGKSRNALSIQQTQRNNEKNEVVETFYKGLKEIEDELNAQVFITKQGSIIEIYNEDVENQVLASEEAKENEELYTGMISIEVDMKIKNLDFNAALLQKEYMFKKKEAEEKQRAKAAEKARKAKRDAELRAEKARIRAKKMEQYLTGDDDDE